MPYQTAISSSAVSEPQLMGYTAEDEPKAEAKAVQLLHEVDGSSGYEQHQMGFAFYQREIYLGGVKGIRPVLTTDPNLWEDAAKKAMTPESFAYLKGGAGAGQTMRKNLRAFERWSIIPRMVRANVRRNLTVNVFGQIWPAPIA